MSDLINEKDALYLKEAAVRFSDVATPARIKIINLLNEQAYATPISFIASKLNVSSIKVKRHIYALRMAQIVIVHDDKVPYRYSIDNRRVNQLLEMADNIVNY